MRKNFLLLILVFVMGYILPVLSQGNFNTSLHATRNGKPHYYNTIANGGTGGFETITGIPMSQLGCVECHDAKDANNVDYGSSYTPGCVDCHATNTPPFPGPVTENDCLGCHSREKAIITMGLPDVHRTAGKNCMFCHKSNDMHGNGTTYNSMFEDGAIATDCLNSGCHEGHTHSNPAVDPHGGKIHCTSCHASTNMACYNCHFESQVETHLKRAQRQITGFLFLVNRTKDNKVHPATFQSLSYQGNTWIAFGPSVAHTIVKTGARTCVDCHKNFGGTIPAIEDYNADGILKFATWNNADSTLSWLQGVIPMPSDWLRSLKLDYITYNGSTSDPVAPSKNWSVIGENSTGAQLLFATPLTNVQMAKIGMDTSWAVIPVELNSFTGSANGLDVILKWKTASEKNNNGFDVQRKVSDEFVSIAFVKGNGTSTAAHEYSFIDKKLPAGSYSYRLKQIDYNGNFEYSSVIEVKVSPNLKYDLMQNFPNPFNPETAIKFTIPQAGLVSAKVYSITGTEVKTLISKEMNAGSYEVKWDGRDNSGEFVTSGIYFVTLSSGTFLETKKMVLLK